MKPIRNILITAFLAIIVITAVSYSACNKNQCASLVCQNQGVCNSGSCVCPVGFEGSYCQTLSRDKFIFTYNGGDTCSNEGYRQYSILLLATSDSQTLNMKHFLNNWDDSAVCTIQATDSFTFTGSNNATSYSGTGKLNHDTLVMYYSVAQDTTSFSCVYVGGQ
jgi:hypothetical protein